MRNGLTFRTGDKITADFLQRLLSMASREFRGDGIITVNENSGGVGVGLCIEALLARLPKTPGAQPAALLWAQVASGSGSIFVGGVTANPYDVATGIADTTTSLTLRVRAVDSGGYFTGGAFAPNLAVGDIVMYEPVSGVNSWEPGNIDGWLQGDVLMPTKTADGTAVLGAIDVNKVLMLKWSATIGALQIVADWDRYI